MARNKYAAMDEAQDADTGASKNKYAKLETKKNRYAELDEEPSLEEALADPAVSTFVNEHKNSMTQKVLDVLGRTMYATAGAAEEALSPKGGGLAAVPGRIGTELASGIGGLKGQKREFTEIMERAGVPEGPSMSDVPILSFMYNDQPPEKSWFAKGGALDFTTRGAAGLAGDIVFDPLTYIGGTGVVTKVGWKALSKAGKAALAVETEKALLSPVARKAAVLAGRRASEDLGLKALGLAPELKGGGIAQFADPANPSRYLREAADALARENLAKAAETAPHLLDKGGLHWMGHSIPGTPRLATAMSGVAPAVVEIAGKIPGGAMALDSVGKLRKGLSAALDTITPGRTVRSLPGLHQAVTDTTSKAFYENARWNGLVDQAKKGYALSDGELKAVAQAVDEGRIGTLTGKPREAAEWIERKGKELLDADIQAGFEVQPVEHYLAHFYENSPDDWARVRKVLRENNREAPLAAASLGRHMEERTFNTLREAEKWTTAQHALDPSVPVLKPVYDPFEALRRRGEKSFTARNWRQFEQNVATRFGPDALHWNVAGAFDLANRGRYAISGAEAEEVQRILGLSDAKPGAIRTTIEHAAQTPEVRVAKRRLEEADRAIPLQYADEQRLKHADEARFYRRRGWDVVEVNPGDLRAYKPTGGVHSQEYVSWKAGRDQAARELVAAERRAVREKTISIPLAEQPKKAVQIGRLSDEAKRAYFAERVAATKSPDELLKVMGKYHDQFRDFFPKATNWAGDLAPNGEVYVPITLKGLGSWYLPKSAAEYVAGLDAHFLNFQAPESKGLKKLLNGYDWVTNTFKLGVTAFPAFDVRNAYNNRAQSFAELGLSALHPANLRDSIYSLAGRDGVVKSPHGMSWSLKDLTQIANERGVITPGRNLLEYSGRESSKTVVRRALEKYRSVVGGAIENEGRMAHFVAGIKRGLSIDEAVASVNKTLVNYTDMTQIEREVMRRVVPFWHWQKSNLVFQLDTLRHRPGLLANQVKPFRGRESENSQMTSFEAGAFKLRLNGDGKTVQMITGIDLPVRNMDLLWRGGMGDTMLGLVGTLAPVPKAAIEGGFNKAAFTGRDFTRKESFLIGKAAERLPPSMQHWLGFDKKTDAAGRPIYTFDAARFHVLFETWAASRFVSTTDRQFREYLKPENRSIAASLLDVATGLRAKNLNIDEEKALLIKERTRMLEEAQIRAGQKREFRRVYSPAPR